jgi:hypothetical protein
MTYSYSYPLFRMQQTNVASINAGTGGFGCTNSTSFSATTVTTSNAASAIFQSSSAISAATVGSGSFGTSYNASGTVSVGDVTPNFLTNNQVVVRSPVNIFGSGSNHHLVSRSATTAPLTPTGINPQALADYTELKDTLTDLYNLEEGEPWRIDQVVYDASIQVAAALLEKNIPKPSVFTHGPKSVVFNWIYADNSLYLTITGSRLAVLVSSPETIQFRAEIAGPCVTYADRFLSAMSSAKLSSPSESTKALSMAR